jgi:asparagine synthase (glutamine-hydrolysing)
MCGISGVLNFDHKPVSLGILEDMIETLVHRGPDASGVFVQNELGLAHSRLSIIDLAGGQQPMHTEDRSLSITFNGEIFNYVELRSDLIQKGHRFVTRSDTEVILHLYQEEGEDCVHKLNGQWAFAIWDSRERTLFISRDRLGIRPVFYTDTGQAFVFASEIKALFAHPEVPRYLDPQGLNQLFTFWITLPPHTAFKNINELPPGHSLTVRDGQVTVRRYWGLRYEPEQRVEDSEGLAQRSADRLLELLVDATRIRLRSDVPVGAYLSGGLDSSVITALVLRLNDAPVHTFSVSFEDAEYDERYYQQEVVLFLGTEHQEIRCSRKDIAASFPQVIWHAERPLVRTAPAPLYLLSSLVHHEGFKVVLTGEGSDEMLGGYDIFKEMKIRRFFGSQPDSRSRPLLLARLYPYMENLQNQSPAYLKAFFHVDPAEINNPFFSHLPRWELTAKLKMFFSDTLRSELQGSDVYAEMEATLPQDYTSWNSFARAQYLEAAYLLPGYILSSQGDRVAMAHSVEGRFPFLDYRLVEFASGLPATLKMKVLNEKYLLKRCAQHLVPKSIAQRSKQPVRAPGAECFFGPETPEYVDEMVSPQRLRDSGIFNVIAVQKLVEKFRQGRAIGTKDSMALVAILSTQLLVHQFLEHYEQHGSTHGKKARPGSEAREDTAVYYR